MENPYRQIALALLDAEESPNATATLANQLLDVSEVKRIIELMSSCASVLAYHGEISPRTVYEQLYASCVSDEAWREIAERWKEERSA